MNLKSKFENSHRIWTFQFQALKASAGSTVQTVQTRGQGEVNLGPAPPCLGVHDGRGVLRLCVGPGGKCSKCQLMEFNSRVGSLECVKGHFVKGHFERFLPGPTFALTRSTITRSGYVPSRAPLPLFPRTPKTTPAVPSVAGGALQGACTYLFGRRANSGTHRQGLTLVRFPSST